MLASGAIKEKILHKALENAVFDGWNNTMLEASAAMAGIEKKAAYIYFSTGISSLVDFFAEENLIELEKAALHLPHDKKLPEKISWLIMEYFKAAGKNQAAIKKLMSYYAMPQNMPHGLRNLHRLVDKIWRLSGDESTDFSYYTKRFSLSTIYSETLLFWLGDNSQDFKATEAFLKRKIGNLMKFHKAKAEIKGIVRKLAGRN